MSENVLLTARGSVLLSNTWKQELTVTDQGVRGEVLIRFRRVKMSLPYDRIAQVNISRGILTADIEIVNAGGADNLVVRALSKSDAERAKSLIEEQMKKPRAVAHGSVADELAKLAELKSKGILTEAEFQQQKQRILSQ